MKKIWIIALLLLFIMATSPANAEMKKLGQAGMSFLNIGGSARAAGMAESFGFAKGDLASVFYNPAGLASVKGRTFMFNYTQWIADMSVTNFAASYDAGKFGVIAVNAQAMNYGDIEGTIIDDSNAGGFSDIDVGDVGALALGLSYAYQMTDKFAVGGNVKYINQKLGANDTFQGDVLQETAYSNKANCFAYDFGTLYDTGLRSLAVHMSIRNYAAQQLYENEEFQLPQTYRVGFSANLYELLPFLPGSDNSFIVDIEGVDPRDREEYLNVGGEYTLMNMIDLRGGYAFQRGADDVGGICAGLGLKLDVLGFGGRFDFSYDSFGAVFGSVMRFSIQGSF